MSKQLVIMRGIPWCGKTYTANEILNRFQEEQKLKGVIFSTDDYFYQKVEPEQPTKYSFDPKFLHQAHNWNHKRASEAMIAGVPLVVIDNTNTVISEAKAYAQMGFVNDYDIRIQEPTSDRWKIIHDLLLDKHKNKEEINQWAQKLAEGSKGTHNVPVQAFEKMMKRWHNNMTVEDLI